MGVVPETERVMSAAVETVDLETPHPTLDALVTGLESSGQVQILRGGRDVAVLVRVSPSVEANVRVLDDTPTAPQPTVRQRPAPGWGRDLITVVADDNEHLEHFRDYMPDGEPEPGAHADPGA